MIVALLSDIHANLEALQACLKHARANGAGRFAFLGDYVGYGADPAAVVAILMGYAADGAILVKGNHEDAVAASAAYMNDAVRESIALAREQLSAEQKGFLSALPLAVRQSDMFFVHASAAAPARWSYVDSAAAALRSLRAADSPYTFSGHVHDQTLFAEVDSRAAAHRPVPANPIAVGAHRRWLALVGSVGQPRDGLPAAAYALFDDAARRITYFRVPYDHHAAATKIRRAGLSAALAHRVERGV
jgi:diadenosine tetraphosphatase ApaH/serine/threonine PP2A family protein phosphatase